MNMLPNTILNAFFCLLFVFIVGGCNHKDEHKASKQVESSVEKKELVRKCYDEITIAHDRLIDFKYHAVQRLLGYFFSMPINSEISLNDELSVLEIDSAKVLLYTKNKNPNKVWTSENGLIRTIQKNHQVVIDSFENELVKKNSRPVNDIESLLSFYQWIDSLDDVLIKKKSGQVVDAKSLLSFYKWNKKKVGAGVVELFFKDESSNIDTNLYKYFMNNIFN